MKKISLVLTNFVLLFAASSQAAVFYSGGEITRITDVSITANYAPWAPTFTRVFDVDIVVGTFADAYASGGLPPGWETNSQNLGLATAATYGLADALIAGGAPVTAYFLGGNEELYVPFFVGDVSSSSGTCFGCVQSRTTYAWSTPVEWRPATYTAVDPGSTVRAWALFTPVSNVPVPAAAWLFSSGLIGLIGVARRKKD
ncbi:MAG: VPLPA-CTERM sorting domain-containing protein [Gammaproteobacteria bacterium]